MSACVRACVRACVHACVHACERVSARESRHLAKLDDIDIPRHAGVDKLRRLHERHHVFIRPLSRAEHDVSHLAESERQGETNDEPSRKV